MEVRIDDINKSRLFTPLLAVALICMSASLILPTWSMQDSLNEVRNINITPYGANYITHSTNIVQYTFVTGLNSGGMIVVGTFLFMTMLTLFFTALEYLYVKLDDDPNKYNGPNNCLYVSGLMAILTPLTFALLLPEVLNVNGNTFTFWGGHTGNGIGTYGPNVGWFLQIIAFVVVLAAIIVKRAINKEESVITVTATDVVLKLRSAVQAPAHRNDGQQNGSPKVMSGTQPRLYCSNCGKVIPSDANLCPYCATTVMLNHGPTRH